MNGDVYLMRVEVPGHWPAGIREWGEHRRALLDLPIPHVEFELLPPLIDEHASDWWLPVASLRFQTGYDLKPEGDNVILIWPDGAMYFGAPLRDASDLLIAYRYARLQLEHSWRKGNHSGVEAALNAAGQLIQ